MVWNTQKGIKLSRKYNIPIVGIEHLARFNENNLENWGNTKNEALHTYNHIDATITVSTQLQQSLKRHFNINSKVVPNLVSKDFFFKQKLNNDSFTIITIGSLIERKGFDLLIKALSICSNTLPHQWKAVIIGGGNLKNKLQQLIDDYRLNNHILLLGSKSKTEIVQLLQNSDMFVLPSRNETFGVVYIEALACGLPIIATECGVPPEIVTPQNGLFIQKENVQELANAIMHIAQNIHWYNRKAIAEDCLARFSSEVIAKQLTEIFEETIKKHKQ
jgi:glycosyltransferase involved in cell wall biosynthesis